MTTARRRAETGAAWLRERRRVVAATLVEVEGSAPFEVGATMLIDADDAIEGSVTGGCVEAALVEEAHEVFAGGGPRIATYGVSDELAGTVGLACGGTVHVLVQELSGPALEVELRALAAVAAGTPVAIATVLDGSRRGEKLAIIDGEPTGELSGPALFNHSVTRDAIGMLEQGASGIRRYGEDGTTLAAEVGVLVQSFAPAPRMLICGAIDFSAALGRIAREVGYEVTIADPREAFLRSPRFGEAGTPLRQWPQDAVAAMGLGPRDAMIVFSHDAKLDEPALLAAFATPVGYIGALGSRRTTAERNRRLLEAGAGEADLRRIHAPCGLDIGGSTPEEVAISVLAEIIAVRNGRAGAPLRETREPIHQRS
ncbi:MAG TPA: XdhC family protein [Solirubrobacterales bacterium]|nr:XdhC family protein [Solirubrobacterales bacterium]